VLILKWDQRFESAFLQRRVRCELGHTLQYRISKTPNRSAASREHSSGDLELTENGILRRDTNVGGEDEFIADRRRTSLDRYNDRLGTNRRSQPKRVDEVRIPRRQYARRLSGRKSRHIEPRAEIGAKAVEHGDTQPVILKRWWSIASWRNSRGDIECRSVSARDRAIQTARVALLGCNESSRPDQRV
jgi:hypothetical protein